MQKQVLLLLLLLIICVGCLSKNKEEFLDENILQKSEGQVTKKYKSDVDSILDSYISKYPLTKVDTQKFTQSCYFVMFSEIGMDSICVIGKQPFVFGPFPDFAFQEMPKKIPEIIGFSKIQNYPLCIYDTPNLIGKSYYQETDLHVDNSSSFYINESKDFDYIIVPMEKYKFSNNNLLYFETTDTLILK